MAITKEFMEAVQAGNKMRVRIMLKDSLLIDPTIMQFEEMEHYAAQKMRNLYTEHDGEELNFDTSTWNEDYLNRQMVVVVNCFSKERIDLLKKMVGFLYKEKVDKIRNEEKRIEKQHKTQKQVGAGMAAAGVVLTAAGISTSRIGLTIGGVAVAVTGIVLIVKDKEGA